jgi:hypothetical protein
VTAEPTVSLRHVSPELDVLFLHSQNRSVLQEIGLSVCSGSPIHCNYEQHKFSDSLFSNFSSLKFGPKLIKIVSVTGCFSQSFLCGHYWTIFDQIFYAHDK